MLTSRGDHVTLQAAADAYGVPINILTSYQNSCFVNLTPRPERVSDRALYLSFFAEVHYNSLYPAGVTEQQIYIFTPSDPTIAMNCHPDAP